MAVFSACWLLTTMLQFVSGAFHSEFVGYPDEPAHVVTSLMAHDYLHQVFHSSPLQFVKEFYVHYPEVAIGHWPPVLYAIAGIWMSIFSASPVSILLLMGGLNACLCTLIFAEALGFLGVLGAASVALVFPLLYVVQQYSGMLMAEIPLALFCFLATCAFARFAAAERARDAILFGLYASLAILTKGSGWLLLAVPLIAVCFARAPAILFCRALWIGLAIILVTCLPWQLATLALAKEGWNGPDPGWRAIFPVAGRLAFLMVRYTVGFAALVFALIGVGERLLLPLRREGASTFWASMGALVIASVIFHGLVPAGIEARKTIMAAPPLLLFSASGVALLYRRLCTFRWMPGRVPAFSICLLVAAVAAPAFRIPQKSYRGFDEAARRIVSDPSLDGRVVLLSTDSQEGPFVAELAMRERRPGHIVLRGTKVLAKTDWNGDSYRSLYETPEQMRDFLRKVPIDLVVLDSSQGKWRFRHHDTLAQMVKEFPQEFRLVTTVPRLQNESRAGLISIYRRVSPTPQSGTPIDLALITRGLFDR